MMALCAVRRLKVAEGMQVLRLRAFPARGEPAVVPGDEVTWDSVLGSYASRQRLRYVKVEASGDEIDATLLVAVGQKVKRGEVLAYYSYMFGLGFKEYASPCNGEIVDIGLRSGVISIKEDLAPLIGMMPGVVSSVDPALGVFVRSEGHLVFAALGIGYGRAGILEVRDTGGAESATVDASDRGKVLVVEGRLTREFLEACMRHRVSGLVVGSVPSQVAAWYKNMVESLDWDELLARYWARDAKEEDERDPSPMEVTPALIATEGYGTSPMSAEALALLKRHSGEKIFIDGAGAYDFGSAGTTEALPCLFIPATGEGNLQSIKQIEGVAVGDKVRVFGIAKLPQEGVVTEINEEGAPLEIGAAAPGVKVDVGGGEIWVPLLNVEKV